MIYASTVDLDEAYKLGQKAALIAAQDGSGFMSTILREPGRSTMYGLTKSPLESGRQFGTKFSEGLAGSQPDRRD